MKINSVKIHCLGVCRCLTYVGDYLFTLMVGKLHTRNLGHIPVLVPRSGNGQLKLSCEALGIAYSAETRRCLKEYLCTVGVSVCRKVAPAGKNGSAAVNSREISQLIKLGY